MGCSNGVKADSMPCCAGGSTVPCDIAGGTGVGVGVGGTYDTRWTLWRERRMPGCDRAGVDLIAGWLNADDGGGVSGAAGDGDKGSEGVGGKTGGRLGDIGGAEGENSSTGDVSRESTAVMSVLIPLSSALKSCVRMPPSFPFSLFVRPPHDTNSLSFSTLWKRCSNCSS